MKDVLEQAAEYQRSYAIVGRGHYLAAERLARFNRWLGVPVVIITAVVGTSIFGTITQDEVGTGWKIVAGIISLAGAVLSALQTSLGFASKSESHKAAAARYRSFKRRLEIFSLKYTERNPERRSQAIAELESIDKELTELASESPSLPDPCYERAVKEYDARHPALKQEAVEVANP